MRSRRRTVALARAGHELRTGPLRSTVRRRRSPQQVGPPAPDWPCRSRRGALDPIAARDGAGQPHLGRFRAAGLESPRVVVLSASLNLRYGLLATGRFLTMIPDSALHYGPRRAH